MTTAALNTLRKAVKKDAKSLLSEAPDTLEMIEQTISTHFPTYKLSDVESQYKTTLLSAASPESSNATLDSAIQAYIDTLSHVIHIIQTFERYITLHIPQMEDGNNFGVTVQMTITKALKDIKESLVKKLDSIPTYTSSRADAVDKLGLVKTVETKTVTSTKLNSKGGKDGEENKESTTEVLEQKSTGSAVAEQYQQDFKFQMRFKALVALDVNCYSNARIGLIECRDSLMMIFDNIDKNKEKLLAPKGSAGFGGNSMGMY